MADPRTPGRLRREHPLQSRAQELSALPAAVRITAEPYLAQVDVRLSGPPGEVGARLGGELPAVPNTWAPTDNGRAIWLGPDEWLLTSTDEAPELLESRVRDAVLPLGGAAVDVSAQRTSLRLRGDRAREVLATGCAIDLHPRVFGRGSSAQTTLGHAGVVLLALSDAGDDFGLLVRSSFAGHLADWLLDAALEHTGPAAG